MLSTVAGSWNIYQNDVLTVFGAPALFSIGGTLSVKHHDRLLSFNASSLSSVDSIMIEYNSDLTGFVLSSLSTITGGVSIGNNGTCNDVTVDSFPCSCEYNVITPGS